MSGIQEISAGPATTAAVTQISSSPPRTPRAGNGNELPVAGHGAPVSGVSQADDGAPSATISGKIDEGDTVNESVENAVRDLNDYVQSIGREIQFSLDEVTGETVIRVIDTTTDETIRQIPSEEMMAFLRNMQELNQDKGNLFEEKV